MKRAVKRRKSKTKTKSSKAAKSRSKRAAAKSKARRTTKAKTVRKAGLGRAHSKLRHVAKKAATAAVVAALDTALGELTPKNGGADAAASDKSEP